jgi:hypothetical protein
MLENFRFPEIFVASCRPQLEQKPESAETGLPHISQNGVVSPSMESGVVAP